MRNLNIWMRDCVIKTIRTSKIYSPMLYFHPSFWWKIMQQISFMKIIDNIISIWTLCIWIKFNYPGKFQIKVTNCFPIYFALFRTKDSSLDAILILQLIIIFNTKISLKFINKSVTQNGFTTPFFTLHFLKAKVKLAH